MPRTTELYQINRVFVQDPQRRLSPAQAPRDDVVCPAVVLAALDAVLDAAQRGVAPAAARWTNAADGDDADVLRAMVVPCPKRYRTQPRVRRLACYLVAHSWAAFEAVADVDGGCAEAVFGWLREHAQSMFMVSGAWYDVDGEPHTMAAATAQPLVGCEARPSLDWVVSRGYYAMASGLLLALALEQAGRWQAGALLGALRRQHACAVDKDLFYVSSLDPAWLNLYINMRYRLQCHVADVPHLYALQCGSDARIARFLLAHIEGAEEPLLQSRTPLTCTLATLPSAAFPLRRGAAWLLGTWPTHDLSSGWWEGPATAQPIPDWPGFVRTLCLNGAVWARWRANAAWRRSVLVDDAPRRLAGLLPAIFFVYESGLDESPVVPRYRLRALWRDVLEAGGALAVAGWLHKHLARLVLRDEAHGLADADAARAVANRVAQPSAPPLPFLRDLRASLGGAAFGEWLHRGVEAAMHVAQEVPPAYLQHLQASRWWRWRVPGRDVDACIGFTAWALLGHLARAASPAGVPRYAAVRAFHAELEKQVAQKLLLLRALPGALGDCMRMHLCRQRSVLY